MEKIIGIVSEIEKLNKSKSDFRMNVNGTILYNRGEAFGNYFEVLDFLGINENKNGKRVEVSYEKIEKVGKDHFIDWLGGWKGIPKKYNQITGIRFIDY
jgi:hypothetical protein